MEVLDISCTETEETAEMKKKVFDMVIDWVFLKQR